MLLLIQCLIRPFAKSEIIKSDCMNKNATKRIRNLFKFEIKNVILQSQGKKKKKEQRNAAL